MLMKSEWYLIAVAGTLSLLVNACVDASSTLGTPVPSAPTPPTPPPPVSRTVVPWAALPDGAEAYYEAHNDLYAFFDYYHGSIKSRYVFYDAHRFGLQFESAHFGTFEYQGQFQRSDSTFVFFFDGWSVAGPWIATGTLSDDQLTISYNPVMFWSDFIDGVYVRLAEPPE